MKTVLWISRHTMTIEQLQSLEHILGEPVKLLCWKDSVYSMDALSDPVHQADLIAAVLPLDLMAKLLTIAEEKPVLRAISKRAATGRYISLRDGRMEQEYDFVFAGWEQIQELTIKTKRFY